MIVTAKDPLEAANGAHAIAILTEWDEFKHYDYEKIYEAMAKPVSQISHARRGSSHFLLSVLPMFVSVLQAFIFDGRNILDHQKLRRIGFEVYAIGKPRTKEW